MKRLALLGLAWFLFSGDSWAQHTWYVDLSGIPPGSGTITDPYTSIQHAIDQPSTMSLDTIEVALGTYVENITFGVKYLHLRASQGPAVTFIRPAISGPVIRVSDPSLNDTIIEGFTITGGFGNQGFALGAGVWMDPPLSRGWVVDCVLTGNEIGIRGWYDAFVIGCTVSGNGVGLQGLSNPLIMQINSSIIRGNDNDFNVLPGIPHIAACYSIFVPDPAVEAGCSNNLNVNPLFWDESNADYHLQPGSPAIDAGDPSLPLDPDGSVPDIGALVFDPTYVPTPVVYCTAKLNSCGTLPAITWSGTSSATASSGFIVSADNTKAGKFGLLLYTDAGRANAPFSGGILCLALPLRRSVPVFDSSGTPGACTGTLSIDMNAFARDALGGNPSPNLSSIAAEFRGQFWARDTLSGALLSDALEFFIGP